VKISSSGGERILPLREFYTGEGRSITRLEANELLTEIMLPALPGRCGAVYEKYAMRSSLDFPLVGTAVFISLNEKDDSCSEARIIFTGVSSGPVEACETGAMLKGERLTEAAIARAGESAAKEVKIFSSAYCPSDQRRRITEVSTQQALLAALQRARKGSI
jgi:CO/xanthine dehydrogenase FAD-binding subunit